MLYFVSKCPHPAFGHPLPLTEEMNGRGKDWCKLGSGLYPFSLQFFKMGEGARGCGNGRGRRNYQHNIER